MKKYLITLLVGPLMFLGCAQNQPTQVTQDKKPTAQKQEIVKKPIEKKVKQPIVKKTVMPKPQMKIKDMQIIGEAEYVYLPATKFKLKARIDTGATTTSINALNIKLFERDGKRWVKFELLDENKKAHERKLPLYEIVSIKRHGAEDQKRPVVKMRINLGTSSQLIRVSLTDRSKFTYPVLIGRNFLSGDSVVDVSRKYSIDPTKDIK